MYLATVRAETMSPSVAINLNNLAALYDDQGKYAEAEPLYKRALAILEEGPGAGPSRRGHEPGELRGPAT